MQPILIASASPSTISRSPSERSSSRSMQTRRGWWNAPMRFLPADTFIAVLPPTDESSMAIIEVGIWTTGTPRINVAATNPVRSPTTPPPRASMHERFFELSPGLIVKVSGVCPAATKESTRRWP
eukprot:scaffold59922_cov31-Tisochrysis_lutea.AAC.1